MSQFARNDYLWIARQLRYDLYEAEKTLTSDARIQAINSIYSWMRALSSDNPRGFDKARFLINCGLTPTPNSRTSHARELERI